MVARALIGVEQPPERVLKKSLSTWVQMAVSLWFRFSRGIQNCPVTIFAYDHDGTLGRSG